MAAPVNRPTNIFISYSRTDSATIDRLEAELIGYGFATWVDREHLEGGDKWAAQIERAIEACDVVVVGLSPDAIASSWVINELFYAQQLGKPIIPTLLRPVERIPLLLASLQYIDMQADESQGLQQLRLRLLRLGKQLATTAAPTQLMSAPPTAPQHIAPTAQERTNEASAQLVPLPVPAPAAALNDLFVQGIAARAHGDLDQAEALLWQVVERDKQFGNGVAAQQLEETQRQLLPIQLERLRQQAQQAEKQRAWGEAIGSWQAFLERAPSDAEAQIALKRDEKNRDAAWIYANARTLAQQQDWVAFRQMWQLLQENAPTYGDPEGIYSLSLVSYTSGILLATCQGHSGIVWGVAWSPDGQRLATASADKTACIWDAQMATLLLTCQGHSAAVTGVAWSPDGQRLATATRNQATRVWDAFRGKELAACKDLTSSASSEAQPSNNQSLPTRRSGLGLSVFDSTPSMTAYRALELRDAYMSKQRGDPELVSRVIWSPDGSRLATTNVDRITRIWDATTCTLLMTCQEPSGDVTDVAWSPDGTSIATANLDTEVRVWETKKGKLLRACQEGHSDIVTSVAWSPDGQWLATASVDKTARVWEAATGRLLMTFSDHTSPVYSVAWSPDSQRIATASYDQIVRVWDARTGNPLLTLKGHTAYVYGVSWSPDGQRLATASADKTVRIWRV